MNVNQINKRPPDARFHLFERLRPVVSRLNWVRMFDWLSMSWLMFGLFAAIMLILNLVGQSFVPHFSFIVAAIAALVTLVGVVVAWLSRKQLVDVVSLIENKYEDLDSILVTAVEQEPDASGELNTLQHDVIRNAVYHSYKVPWRRVISTSRAFLAPVTSAVTLMMLVGFLFAYWWFAKPVPVDPSIMNFNKVSTSGRAYQLSVVPGDTEVEAGSSLLVLAQFGENLPPNATLVYQTSDNGEQIEIPMSKSLEDPVFGGRIPAVHAPTTYSIRYGGTTSEEYEVTTFEFPKLVRSDAELEFPEFTQLDNKIVQDVRRISAVQGTEVTFQFILNKAVDYAELRTDEDDGLPLTKSDEENTYSATIKLVESKQFHLHLMDSEGRRNKVPPQFKANVLQNKQPDLKLVQPSRDLQVSPLEEIDLAAKAWDDFGLTRVGLSYSIGGENVNDVVLAESLEGKRVIPLEHQLAMEQLQAEPDQLVSYYFWAEDRTIGNTTRRTASDMYFAEVRHFEEIFRQGQAPAGGQQPQPQQNGGPQSQNAQQAQQLADLQKEIINATWKIIRTESGDNVSRSFAENTRLIAESQRAALEQLLELAEQVQDPQAKSYVVQIRSDMDKAAQLLEQAANDETAQPLQRALSSEQEAKQGLLKLRAREHEVVQQNQMQNMQQSQQQPNSRSQQQLQQLQLREDVNRYEQEQLAQPEQQNAEQREDRQVLSRLRELARRQNDLNERVKELQSALDEAEDEEEKEEIRRQLKRLQEEQEQILRDTDELQERMANEQNQQRMSEEARQLEQARENIRRAQEAMENGELTRAAAEGTRAEREMRDLRDEFQERTSSQFSEQMREMRDQARNLENNQERIDEELEQLNENERSQPNSLAAGDQREDLTQQLLQQEQDLEKLRTQIRDTVEEAEEFEPLLAEELYDTYRQSEQDRPGEALKSAARSLRSGFLNDAQNEQQRAADGVEKIREGIDEAAERVLGDETEALRRAKEELERLSNEIQNEAKQLNPDSDSQNESQRSTQRSDNQEDEQTNRQPSQDGRQDSQTETDSDQPGGNGQRGNEDENQFDEDQNRDSRETQQGNRPGRQRLDDDRQIGGASEGTQRSGFRSDDASLLPLTGEDFMDWSDRLRDVEEMIADPELRAEATRIRENARDFRKELKRHGKEPNWDLVKLKVIEPLVELQGNVINELLRRTSDDSLVPVDRDPVPPQYQDAVKRYYEELGKGQ